MNKKLIRLTESDLHRIVKESVNKALREDFDRGMDITSMLRAKMEDVLRQNGLEYDTTLNGFSVYPDNDNIVNIEIYKEGNIPYPRR